MPARAALVVNGDFETGSLSGWTATGNVVAQATPFFGFNNSDYGSYFAVFNAGNDAAPNGVLSQTISTVVGTNYVLSFDYGANGHGQSMNASAYSDIGDALATELVFSNTAVRQGFLLNFAATSTGTTIRFTDNPSNNTIDADGGVDNVSVTASVPEPGSLALLCFGAAGVVNARRRGRKAA